MDLDGREEEIFRTLSAEPHFQRRRGKRGEEHLERLRMTIRECTSAQAEFGKKYSSEDVARIFGIGRC